MYDIPELEKKWRIYKRNKVKKPIIILSISIVVLLAVGALITTYLSKTKKSDVTKKVVQSPPSESQAKPVPVVKNNNTNAQNSNSNAMVITKVDSNQAQTNSNALIQVKKSDSDNGIDISKAEIVKPNVPDDEIRVIGFDNKDKDKIKKKYEDILIPKQSQDEIARKEKVAEIEERFKDSQDPQDSLYLARYYYKRREFKKAESWAVSTNNIDGDIEESWLIFAKARAKQGFRVDAIKVLQSFYDETNSAKAKKLLDKIRRGLPF